jgi:hypothetical protein
VQDFTSDECSSDDCFTGGRMSFVPLTDNVAPKIDIAAWVLPTDGVFELGDGLTIELHETASPVDVRFASGTLSSFS